MAAAESGSPRAGDGPRSIGDGNDSVSKAAKSLSANEKVYVPVEIAERQITDVLGKMRHMKDTHKDIVADLQVHFEAMHEESKDNFLRFITELKNKEKAAHEAKKAAREELAVIRKSVDVQKGQLDKEMGRVRAEALAAGTDAENREKEARQAAIDREGLMKSEMDDLRRRLASERSSLAEAKAKITKLEKDSDTELKAIRSKLRETEAAEKDARSKQSDIRATVEKLKAELEVARKEVKIAHQEADTAAARVVVEDDVAERAAPAASIAYHGGGGGGGGSTSDAEVDRLKTELATLHLKVPMLEKQTDSAVLGKREWQDRYQEMSQKYKKLLVSSATAVEAQTAAGDALSEEEVAEYELLVVQAKEEAAAKKVVKKKITKWNKAFTAEHGEAPTKKDMAPIQEDYDEYKRLDKTIKAATKRIGELDAKKEAAAVEAEDGEEGTSSSGGSPQESALRAHLQVVESEKADLMEKVNDLEETLRNAEKDTVAAKNEAARAQHAHVAIPVPQVGGGGGGASSEELRAANEALNVTKAELLQATQKAERETSRADSASAAEAGLRGDMEKMKGEIEAAAVRSKDAEARHAQLMESMASGDQDGALSALDEDRKAAVERAEAAEGSLAAMQAELSSAKGEAHVSEETLRNLKSDLARALRECEDAKKRADASDLEAKEAVAAASVASSSPSNAAPPAAPPAPPAVVSGDEEVAARMAELEAELKESQIALDTAEKEVEELRSAVDEAEANADAAQAEADAANVAAASSVAESGGDTGRSSKKDTPRADPAQAKEISKLKSEVKKLTKQVGNMVPAKEAGKTAKALEKAQSKIGSLEKQVEKAKNSKGDSKKLGQAQAEVEKLKSKMADNDAKLKKEMTKKLEDMEKKLVSRHEKASSRQQEEADKALAASADKVALLETECKKRQAAITKAEDEAADSKKALKNAKKEASEMEESLQKLKDEVGDVAELKSQLQEANKTTAQLSAETERLGKMYREEMLLRKKYYNTIEDMKGKIRVFCRVRPLSGSENERGNVDCTTLPDEYTITMGTGVEKLKERQYQYDQVFGPGQSQEDVYENVGYLVQSAIDGFNVCIFAYGQTGSGKTYTISGGGGNKGISPRAIEDLFRIQEESVGVLSMNFKVYMVELYNDQLVDLLRPKSREKPPKLTIKKDAKGMVFVHNATVSPANTREELQEIWDRGNGARRVSSTKMNSESSRSHLIFAVLVEAHNLQTGTRTTGKLSMVDLAGSERVGKTGATKERLREAQNINKSLSALGDVIKALSSGESFVPYRNNKLTLCMSDSLGGNAKTLMFVNVSPADYNYDETNVALAYASRVKLITNNADKASETKEVVRLKAMIKALRDGGDLEAVDKTPEAEDMEVDDDLASKVVDDESMK